MDQVVFNQREKARVMPRARLEEAAASVVSVVDGAFAVFAQQRIGGPQSTRALANVFQAIGETGRLIHVIELIQRGGFRVAAQVGDGRSQVVDIAADGTHQAKKQLLHRQETDFVQLLLPPFELRQEGERSAQYLDQRIDDFHAFGS